MNMLILTLISEGDSTGGHALGGGGGYDACF